MCKFFKKFSIIFLVLGCCKAALANNNIAAIGVTINTAGVGIEGRMAINNYLYGRLGINYLHYIPKPENILDEKNVKIGKQSAKLVIFTVPIFLDYHPFATSNFRISAGIAYNGFKITETVTVFDDTLQKTLFFNPISPMVTIGYDSSLRSDSSFSFSFDFGVARLGDMKYSARSNLPIDARDREDLERHLKTNRNKLWWPIISLGLKYSF